jgi:dTDP-glucose 4,6-dehydratase
MSHTAEEYAGAPDTLQPGSAYGEAKRLVEMMCASYSRHNDLPIVISRGYAFSGPYLPLEGTLAFGNFIRNALTGSPIDIQGDGTPCRSYLYGADLAVWLWTMLLKGETCYPYNTGSDQVVSIRELAEIISAESIPALPVRIARQPISGVLPARYVPSIQRAKETLGLTDWTSLKDAIRKTLAWQRGQGQNLTGEV